MCVKRTTLILEDGCLEGVKNLARQQDRTVSEVVNEILAEGIQRRETKVTPSTPVREIYTTDTDFLQFPGIRVINPLQIPGPL